MAKTKSAKKGRSAANSGSPVATPITVFESASQSGLEERIRQRAYQLFLERGSQSGGPEEDWLRAEAEVLGHSGRKTA